MNARRWFSQWTRETCLIFAGIKFGRTFETLLNHKCEIYVDPRRVFNDDISVMSELFAPVLRHLSDECVLRLRDVGLHLPHQVCGANYVWTGKRAYLRAFSTMCLIKHSKKFHLATGSQSIATEYIVTKWSLISWYNDLKLFSVWCCVSALGEITALFAGGGSDSLMGVEKHNLQILLKDLVATAVLYTWTKNSYAMEARVKPPWKKLH